MDEGDFVLRNATSHKLLANVVVERFDHPLFGHSHSCSIGLQLVDILGSFFVVLVLLVRIIVCVRERTIICSLRLCFFFCGLLVARALGGGQVAKDHLRAPLCVELPIDRF